MNLGADSRYAAAGIAYTDVDTLEVYLPAVRVPLALPVDPTDRYVNPIPDERLEQLAYRVWQDDFGERATRLWWVIADVNDITNPFAPLDPGKALRCPTADRLVLEVLP